MDIESGQTSRKFSRNKIAILVMLVSVSIWLTLIIWFPNVIQLVNERGQQSGPNANFIVDDQHQVKIVE